MIRFFTILFFIVPITSCEQGSTGALSDSLGLKAQPSDAPVAPSPSFIPATLNFGSAIEALTYAESTITLTNGSTSTMYLGIPSVDSTIFSIVSSTCPKNSEVFDIGSSCQITLRFSPTQADSVIGKLKYSYGIESGSHDLSVIASLSGVGNAQSSVGDSALTFNPTSYDFGLKSVNETTDYSVSVKNSSLVPIYLNGFTGGTSSFTIVSDTCSRSPTALTVGSSCTVKIRFVPLAGGTVSMILKAAYGISAGTSNFSSISGISGTGVSALSFSGLTTISNVTTTKAVLNWTHVSGATNYFIFKVDAGVQTLVTTVAPPTATYQLSSLTPSTTYTYRVRATDQLGMLDSNTSDISTTTKNIGTFSAIADLSAAEGTTALSPVLSCSDTYGNTPTITISSESDSASTCTVVAGPKISCTPTYKTAHTTWTSSVSVNCNLNDTVFNRSFTVSVSDTNRAPSLATIAAQSLTATNAITAVNASDSNTSADTDVDGDTITYSCTYSGGGASAGTACSSLPNTSYSFNTTTGTLNWTPSVLAAVSNSATAYSITITGSDGQSTPLSDTETFVITVSGAIDLTDNDDTATGFGGGSKVGVNWNTDSTNKIILAPDTDCDGNMSEGETIYTNCSELDQSWTPQWSSIAGYWKMNNNWNDSKGTNHGTGLYSIAFSTSAKIGSHAGQFDGSDDRVDLTTTIAGGTQMTYMAWVNRSSSGAHPVFGSNAAGTNSILLLYGTTAVYTGNGSTQINWSLDTSKTINKWIHVALTKTSNTLELYINGVSYGTQSLTGISDAACIGCGQSTFRFQGKMDEAAIWTTALTPAEIQTIYSRQSPKYSGSFRSRVMDYGASIRWNGLKWLTTLPFGKNLTGDATGNGTIDAVDSETSTNYSALVGSTNSTSDNNLMSSILNLWHFDNSAADSAGTYTLSTQGSPTYSQEAILGGYSGSIPASSYFKITPNNAYTSAQLAAGTISLWFKSEVSGYLIDLEGKVGIWSDTGNTATAWLTDSSATATMTGTTYVKDKAWHHATLTWSGSSACFYVDGILNGSCATIGSPNMDGVSAAQSIGATNAGASVLVGQIDEVAIWSRALHANEVKQLYRRGANLIKYQVRTCTTADCSDNATWLGADNTTGSYFSERFNYAPYNFETSNCSATNLILTGSPSLMFNCFTGALSNLTNRQYFQYRAILESDDVTTNCNYGSGATWCSPELKSVEIKP